MRTDEFLLMHSEFVKKRCGSIYLHIDSRRMRRGGKIFKLHAFTGALQEMSVPFSVSEDSKFNVIGAANGNMAIRCAEADNTSQVIVWNPVSSYFRLISEFTHGHHRLSYSAYGFGYIPNSTEYFLVNIYKLNSCDKNCWCTSYSSLTRQWSSPFICPEYVQLLNSKYVLCDGLLYWLNFNDRVGTSPQCIVYYSAKDNEFGYLQMPEKAVNLEKRLISINDVVCFVGLESGDGEIYTWTIWMINSVDGSTEWTTFMKASGCGQIHYPEAFISNEILMLRETVNMHQVSDSNTFLLKKEIRIRGLSSTASQSRTIQNMEFRVDSYTKSILAMYDTAFPV
ncbi:hypothetical protein PIB30_066394 [Stylosanthes scabra]|uniref:F-box associated beta-propeller type 1 domain-containing protein n=1 Tax=Stylosanthes scabra TaxID=79078 RepID=A0ABU6XK67_9FABA|nr:hypothetical protein [Stylosanthes scabra]